MKIIYSLFLSIALLGSLSVSRVRAQQLSIGTKISTSSAYKDLIVDSNTSKTFRDLQIVAESKAASYVKQAFNGNASQISLRVLGDRNGSISPILTISVSNAQWRSQPKIQTWAKYYPVSTFLLGYSIRPAIVPPIIAVSPPVNPTTNPASKPATSPPKVVNITTPLNSIDSAPANVPRASLPEVQNLPGFRDD